MTPVTIVCVQCGKTATRPPSAEKRRIQQGMGGPYCSPDCRYEAHKKRVVIQCEECGQNVERKRSEWLVTKRRNGGFFCSQSCWGNSRREHAVDRFMSKWRYEKGCWRWISAFDESQHGKFRWNDKTGMAHRFVFQIYHGRPIRPTYEIHHRCENSWCVNPLHLEELTRREHFYRHPRERNDAGDFVPRE